MTFEEKTNALCENELFQDSKSVVSSLLTDADLSERLFAGGELVFSQNKFSEAIGLIISGLCEAKNCASGVRLYTLQEGDVFGLESLFLGAECFPDEIYAKGKVRVLFIEKSAVISLISLNRSFALKYIRRLSQRIEYLNKKVASFTGKTAEARLAMFLLGEFAGYKIYHVQKSLTDIAVSLDIGRASLYRAFDILEKSGAIEKRGKEIRLIDKEKLQKFV